jgi:hypothetical protein
MTKQELLDYHKLNGAEFAKLLQAMDFDKKATDFTAAEADRIEQVLIFKKDRNCSWTEAIALVERQTAMETDPSYIDPDLKELIDIQLATLAKKSAEETPYFLKQQQEAVKRYIIRKYWERVNALVASGEMQRAFERVLGSSEVVEANVLPGESSALPERCSSDT